MLGLKGIPATFGGVERHVEELSARLAGRGHEVTVYCRRNYTPSGPFDHAQGRPEQCRTGGSLHRGVRLRILPSLSTKHLDAVSHTALAAADIAARPFDVVHFHSAGPALLSFVPRIASRRPCAVVATVHAMDWRRRKWGPFARWWLRRGAWAAVTFPHRTIVVSRRMEGYFAGRGKRVLHIPNGVEAPCRAPLDELRRLGVEKDQYVLWMGRFVPEKRVEDLIAAFLRLGGGLVRQSPERSRMGEGGMKLLLAGEVNEADPYFQSLRSAAGGDPRIIFPGGLYGRAKAEALSNAALVALTSDLEGFPIALLEGMRYGRPVLASDIPENLEAVWPQVNGFTFRTGDPAALHERMAWILAHPAEAAAAGRRAERDSQQYDWDVIAGQVDSVYRAALKTTRNDRSGSGSSC
jgi:glycosyltransferase involved in cell wall biosynthesis